MKKWRKDVESDISRGWLEEDVNNQAERLSDAESEQERADFHAWVMSVLIDCCYGQDVDRLCNLFYMMGMDEENIVIFKGCIFNVLLEKGFYKLPGALSKQGLAVAISKTVETIYAGTSMYGHFLQDLEYIYSDICENENSKKKIGLTEMIREILEKA